MNPDLHIVEKLNNQFLTHTTDQHAEFKPGEGGIPVLHVQNTLATASVSLQGANILSWIPYGEEEVIWLSEDAVFAPGKSVRGGIPICWPWFGAHESNTAFPAHGFARTVLWQVTDVTALATGETQVRFVLDTTRLDEKYQPMWPQATVAEYCITIGKTLTLELSTINKSDQPMTIGQALHTYFFVDDVRQTKVSGLDGKDYLDKTEGFARKTQSGDVTIAAEVDRIYLNTTDDNVISDTQRNIVIKKQGSHSTVVWNPWVAVAEKMGDLGKDGYLNMLCVESANAADDTVVINAGERFTLKVSYAVEK